jgi:hypothetical protein
MDFSVLLGAVTHTLPNNTTGMFGEALREDWCKVYHEWEAAASHSWYKDRGRGSIYWVSITTGAVIYQRSRGSA